MQHSTQTLDLSSDDEASPMKGDKCNKENVAPAGYHQASGDNSPSRRDQMTEDIRTPLADLVAHDYYAAGCDAQSFFHVVDEGLEGWEELIGSNFDDDKLVADEDAQTVVEVWESGSAKDEAETLAGVEGGEVEVIS